MSFPITEILIGGPFTKQARLNSIRNLAADVHTETIPDEEIEITALRKDSKVFQLTDKYNWLETDEKFPLIIDASNCYTAAEFLRGFADSQSLTEADALELKANTLIQEINGESTLMDNSETVTTEGIAGTQNGTFN